ncbi:MAG: class I SAM-dependent methyltransferase [Nitrosarchaeum sp.]
MYQNKENINWLHFIRNAELKTALNFFPIEKNIKILEIGGGDGFMAKKIYEHGYEITSIDQTPKHPQYFPVVIGNATKLNFESKKFDVIFSSHVVAHIDKIEPFFAECKRILKKDGVIVHIVPSTAWSIGTNFWHYILLPKFFREWRNSSSSLSTNTNNFDVKIKTDEKQKIMNKIINVLFLHPLGTNSSFVHEFYYFSKNRWKKLFQNHGFTIIDIENGPYLYSGHNILKNKLLGLRRILAKIGFAGSFCFVLKK